MAVYNDGSGAALYFRATADGTDYDLWRYTGSGSPELVDDLLEGAADGSMTYGPLVVLNGALYFTATSTTYGSELWRYDGAVASRLSDINPGSGHSGVRELTVAGSVLYFAANDGAENELWRFDGTSVSLAADTDEELDGADTQSGGSYPMELCSWAGDLYFTAKTDTYGMELYRYDGTSVTNAADIAPGGGMNGSSQPMHTTAFSIGLIVAATATGYEPMDTEPWHFNGASATLAADVNPMGSSDPTGFTEYNGALYFSACDDSYDYELWTLTY
jgi:ELWxxDGT repeat protein